MTPFPALEGLRIGCVQYLNSRPLIHCLGRPAREGPASPGLFLAHPSALAARLREGALDAALVPVFEVLRSPELYRVVRGVAIASRGPVYSVYVAHSEPLDRLEAVVADPASLTSVHLFQVLAAGSLGRSLPLVDPAVAETAPGSEPPRGRLLIGNQAIEFRLRPESETLRFWDLGEAWTEWTGLPFVYAVWVLRRQTDRADRLEAVAEAFREAAALGVAQAGAIAEQQQEFPRDLAHRYLTSHIRYGLGPEEEAGLDRFSSELERGGHVPGGRRRVEFV
jgi:chorismate dehydratase